jgi:hypothetical protein
MAITPALPLNILYPHRVSIRRNLEQPKAGKSSYDGAQASAETTLMTGVMANVQIDRTGRPPDAKLPADPIGAPTHKIFFPGEWLGGTASGYGFIRVNDILVDDLGQRFQVIVTEYQPLALQVRAQLMET